MSDGKAYGWGYDPQTGKPYIKGECNVVEFAKFLIAVRKWNKEHKNPKDRIDTSQYDDYKDSGLYGKLIADNYRDDFQRRKSR